MNDSNSSSDPPTPRATLKLKVAPRAASDSIKAPPTAQTPSKPQVKSDARWSDEYKRRMQADMDALVR